MAARGLLGQHTLLLVAAVATGRVVWRRGYSMSEDDLLAIAAAREGAEGPEARDKTAA